MFRSLHGLSQSAFQGLRSRLTGYSQADYQDRRRSPHPPDSAEDGSPQAGTPTHAGSSPYDTPSARLEHQYRTKSIRDLVRRCTWFTSNLTPRRAENLARMSAAYVSGSLHASYWPPALKIDITPLCNLRCISCIHADPRQVPGLENQVFRASQRMPLERYEQILAEVGDHSSAVSLYYLGDPYLHPETDAMCRIAHDRGLNVHVSTNFSFALSDERIARIAHSGITHLTICVDGIDQRQYQRTRVGGNIDRVLDNLKRLCDYRRRVGIDDLTIEVQFIKFDHNLGTLEHARALFREWGVDRMTEFWGQLHNMADEDLYPSEIGLPHEARWRPTCFHPFSSMLIKYNGDVIPCCIHRQTSQYDRKQDPRVLGNVFETSVQEVWQSPAYQQIRHQVTDPQAAFSTRGSKQSFCYGCGRLFHNQPNQRKSRVHDRLARAFMESEAGGAQARHARDLEK